MNNAEQVQRLIAQELVEANDQIGSVLERFTTQEGELFDSAIYKITEEDVDNFLEYPTEEIIDRVKDLSRPIETEETMKQFCLFQLVIQKRIGYMRRKR